LAERDKKRLTLVLALMMLASLVRW